MLCPVKGQPILRQKNENHFPVLIAVSGDPDLCFRFLSEHPSVPKKYTGLATKVLCKERTVLTLLPSACCKAAKGEQGHFSPRLAKRRPRVDEGLLRDPPPSTFSLRIRPLIN